MGKMSKSTGIVKFLNLYTFLLIQEKQVAYSQINEY